jgi:L-amino acid N-acyltransferase YncA
LPMNDMKLSRPRDGPGEGAPRCRADEPVNCVERAGESMRETPSEFVVRPSVEDDVPAMLAIYSHHIQRGLGPFDVEPLRPDDIKRRRKNMLNRRLPHLVAELDGTVVGYAYAVPFRKRPAYRYAVKNSIYVHADHLHAGVGRKLLPALIEACAGAGFRQMIAYIDAGNAPSLYLHKAFGFAPSGELKGVGFKYGRWTDIVLMQRPLGLGDGAPPRDDDAS